jgi:hypothetical protein
MARMYPSEPSSFNNSKAEKILFFELKKQLTNEYAVIHSKRWINRWQKEVWHKQGECDFIILHPLKGILFVEAKSGKVFYCSGIEKYWYSENGRRMKNPLHQVSTSQYSLMKFINEKIENLTIPYNIALAFPEADNFDAKFLVEILPDMIILEPDIKRLQYKIEKAINAVRGPLSEPISKKIFDKILNILIAQFQITTSLQCSLNALENQFFQLEKRQIEILNQFERNRHAIIDGCAGSGKTLIAIEKACRASRNGKSVLLLCFNRALADFMGKRLKEQEVDVDVFNFHGLCEFIITQTGGTYKPYQENLREFYDRISPQLLSDSIPRFIKRYDLIIVDEAQDFIEDWWYPIIDLQRNPKGSEFYIFRDLKQNIFLRKSAQPFDDGVLITLDTNYRNTPAIIKWLNEQCQANICIPDQAEKGIDPVEVRVKDDQHEICETEKVINRLVNKEKISPNKIVILGKHPLKESAFNNVTKIGGLKIVEEYFLNQQTDNIRYLSVYRFKGLEADCVLFTGIGRPARADIKEDPKAVLLTGASRAKKLLYLFCRKSLDRGNFRRA